MFTLFDSSCLPFVPPLPLAALFLSRGEQHPGRENKKAGSTVTRCRLLLHRSGQINQRVDQATALILGMTLVAQGTLMVAVLDRNINRRAIGVVGFCPGSHERPDIASAIGFQDAGLGN
jgi:hypothetical protein